ncbi:hypothetical protein AB0M47_39410 [Hamadaea sp. NPDC051192]|uniref:hypothetical protein n=1 Tax=Hamadaea sp. NPDC051192 TaxID=3154940 RepID=UPI00343A55B9
MTTYRDAHALTDLQARRRDPHGHVLLTGAHVISMDPALGDFVGDVLIQGDHIEQVGPGLAAQAGPDTLVIDAAGSAVLPGFVDSHVHAWKAHCAGSPPTRTSTATT